MTAPTDRRDSAGGSEEERDMRKQVQRGAAAECHRGHGGEGITDVAERRLEAEGKEHDAGDHR
jgi:hypothetical protein